MSMQLCRCSRTTRYLRFTSTSRCRIGAVVGHPGDPRVDRAAANAGAIPAGYSMPPYRSSQPPLYYMLAAIIALPLTHDPLTVLYVGRLTAALFASATIYLIVVTAV